MTKHDAARRRWLPWLLVPVAAGAALAGCSSSGSSGNGGSASASSAIGCPVTSVADQVLPSVVTIAAGGPGGAGTGSGEVIRSDGYILTNNHVIAMRRQRREGRGDVLGRDLGPPRSSAGTC